MGKTVNFLLEDKNDNNNKKKIRKAERKQKIQKKDSKIDKCIKILKKLAKNEKFRFKQKLNELASNQEYSTRKWQDYKDPERYIKRGIFSDDEIQKLMLSLVNYCKKNGLEKNGKFFYFFLYKNCLNIFF